MLQRTESISYTYNVDESKLTEKDKQALHFFTITYARAASIGRGEKAGTLHYFVTQGELKGIPISGVWNIS